MYKCAHCNGALHVGAFILKQSLSAPMPVRCTRCGAVSSYSDRSVAIISPPNMPFEHGGTNRKSPWMDRGTRPVHVGTYECRFDGVNPVLRLWWDGRHFSFNGRNVQMRTFKSWRGLWV